MGLPPDDADHFVTYTTPRGSSVTLPNLTAEQRDAALAALDPGPALAETAAKEPAQTQTCGQCQGAGGWHETVTTKTASGGTVTTQKWVNCRKCGGSGQVPK